MHKLRKEATVPTKLLKYRPRRHQIGERAAYQRDIFVRVLECTDGVGVALIGGRPVFALFGGGRQKPALPMKDEDRLKFFNSLAAGSATFKADGHTHHELRLPGTSSGLGRLRSGPSRSKATL